jgi:hypothetical protein
MTSRCAKPRAWASATVAVTASRTAATVGGRLFMCISASGYRWTAASRSSK